MASGHPELSAVSLNLQLHVSSGSSLSTLRAMCFTISLGPPHLRFLKIAEGVAIPSEDGQYQG